MKLPNLKTFHSISNNRSFVVGVVVVSGVILIGMLALILTRAAGTFVSVEPENGTVSGPAVKVTDPAASGGSGVKFAAPAPTAPTSVSMVSWNIGPDNARDVGAEIIDLMRFADIMGTQELNNGPERDAVERSVTCSTCAYASSATSHTYDGSSPDKQMIIWKKSVYDKVDMGFVNVSPTQAVNDGICNCDLPVKFIAWVKLKHKASGRQFYVLNTHLVNGVESGGKPRTDASSTRINNYKNHMDKIVALVTQLKQQNLPIFSTGDYNCNFRYDRTVKNSMFPYVRMGSVGAKSSFDVLNLAGIGATPDRLIDYVWHVVRSDVVVKSNNFSQSTHGSDHHAIYSTAEISNPVLP